MSRILSVWVDNKPGVLARIAGLIARRGFNIESLAVSITEEDVRSRVTMVVDADERIVEQVTKQLHKLINVYKVTDLTDKDHIERELVLFKVNAEPEKRGEIIELAGLFGARVDGGAPDSLIIELTDTAERIEAFEALLGPYGIREMIRTGKVALAICPTVTLSGCCAVASFTNAVAKRSLASYLSCTMTSLAYPLVASSSFFAGARKLLLHACRRSLRARYVCQPVGKILTRQKLTLVLPVPLALWGWEQAPVSQRPERDLPSVHHIRGRCRPD